MLVQIIAVLGAAAYSGLGTVVLLKIIGALTSLRVTAHEEALGLDPTQHGEAAYSGGEGAILVLPDAVVEASLEHAEAQA